MVRYTVWMCCQLQHWHRDKCSVVSVGCKVIVCFVYVYRYAHVCYTFGVAQQCVQMHMYNVIQMYVVYCMCSYYIPR